MMKAEKKESIQNLGVRSMSFVTGKVVCFSFTVICLDQSGRTLP